MSYYQRYDYQSPKGTEDRPIEQAMTIFVQWAIANDRNYSSDIVKDNLAGYLAGGETPEQAVQSLLARVRR